MANSMSELMGTVLPSVPCDASSVPVPVIGKTGADRARFAVSFLAPRDGDRDAPSMVVGPPLMSASWNESPRQRFGTGVNANRRRVVAEGHD